jgi:uncharacterized protein (TIGR00730 family)
MSIINRITVFCSVSAGADPAYLAAARELGAALAERDITLVYGGSGQGMAGKLARAALEGGGKIIGVMPRFLVERGLAFDQVSDLRVAEDLHAHKAIFAELGDGFIAPPGGLGTLEEFMEIFTWAQLGLHHKPCGLLNVNGYYDKLISFLDQMRDDRFITSTVRDSLLIAEKPDALLNLFDKFYEDQANP